jgi:hypothetical protein
MSYKFPALVGSAILGSTPVFSHAADATNQPSAGVCNTSSASISLNRYGVISGDGTPSYFIRPGINAAASCNDTSLSVAVFNASPYIDTHIAKATVKEDFSWGSVSAGILNYSLFGTTGTQIGADKYTFPTNVLGYRFQGNINGLGSEADINIGKNWKTAISITDSAISTLPDTVPNNVGKINARVETSYQGSNGFGADFLAIQSWGGKLPNGQGTVVSSQTAGVALSYAKPIGPVVIRADAETAYNTSQGLMAGGSVQATWHATPRTDVNLLASTIGAKGQPHSPGVQGMVNYQATHNLSLTAGAGFQRPNTPYGLAGFTYTVATPK